MSTSLNKKMAGLAAAIVLMLGLLAVPAIQAMNLPGFPDLQERQDSTVRETRARTYVNPIDIPYRFQPPYAPYSYPQVSFREAADPMVQYHNGEYYMFCSHSLGYFHSKDLTNWDFIKASGYAIDKFAPTTWEINGKLYLATSENVNTIWTTDDVNSGQWHVAQANLPWGYSDPAMFVNDDGRLYYYDGLSANGPLYAVELNNSTFQPLNVSTININHDKANRGFEVPGNDNEIVNGDSYVEGSWMTKHNGRYYLEYSTPGTQYRSYSNGLFSSDGPMGPWKFETISPFAHKSTGFITGAGHGATFLGPQSQYWHVATLVISVRHWFERRLGIYPTTFNDQGLPIVDTYLADYPHYWDGHRGLVGWMVLSRKKTATASSSQSSDPSMAADENVQTWWTAATGNAGEWFMIDLDGPKSIQALQVNFADQDAVTVQTTSPSDGVFKYIVETSLDGKAWKTIVNEDQTGRDAPHAYHVLAGSVQGRYVRITNTATTPNGAKFSLYDLRVFGNDKAVALPSVVASGTAVRETDKRRATLSWPATAGAQFYVVRMGTRKGVWTQNFQVYDNATSYNVGTLNVGVPYYFTVDAVNENGITKGTVVTTIPA